jgi:hypothetical protein
MGVFWACNKGIDNGRCVVFEKRLSSGHIEAIYARAIAIAIAINVSQKASHRARNVETE